MCLVCVAVLCWIDHVWSSKACVCCACDPNERLSAPSICFVCRKSLNCAPTQVCRKSASRPGYVVKVRTDPGYVVKQCPRIVMNKIFDWH